MAIDPGAAVAGKMLQHRQHPAGQETRGHRAANRRHLLRAPTIGAIADHLIGSPHRQIRDRQTVDVDAQLIQVLGDETRAEAGRSETGGSIALINPTVRGSARILGPVRRTQPLHAAAFLVDQNRRVASHGFAAFGDQLRNLRWGVDVAFEYDEAPGLRLAHERAFFTRQRRARNAGDECKRRHRGPISPPSPRGSSCQFRRMMHCPPVRLRPLQNWSASLAELNGPTIAR